MKKQPKTTNLATPEIDKRSVARQYAFEICYSLLFDKENIAIQRYQEHPHYQKYIVPMHQILLDNFDKILAIVQKEAEGYKTERLYKVDLAIMMLATAEMLYFDKIPTEVSINEALELAKVYSTTKSPKYINGVLAGVVKAIQAEWQ